VIANVADRGHIPCIYALAGTNGAGKSSVGGAMFRESGAEYFNPDEAALRFIIAADPALTRARLALVRGLAIVIASGLAVIGVEPVEEM